MIIKKILKVQMYKLSVGTKAEMWMLLIGTQILVKTLK